MNHGSQVLYKGTVWTYVQTSMLGSANYKYRYGVRLKLYLKIFSAVIFSLLAQSKHRNLFLNFKIVYLYLTASVV
jgi:hypothetical protein